MTEPNSKTRVLLPVAVAIPKEQMMAAMLPLLRFHTSKLVLFHVVKGSEEVSRGEGNTSEEFARVKDSLDSLSEWLRGQGYEVEIKIEAARDIVHAIVKEATRSEYSMVFMMKRKKKTGIRKLFTKSVTENVVKRAECPVVSVLV